MAEEVIRAKLSGKIIQFTNVWSESALVEIVIPVQGQFESDKASGKDVGGVVTLKLKELFAERLRYGQKVRITIDFGE